MLLWGAGCAGVVLLPSSELLCVHLLDRMARVAVICHVVFHTVVRYLTVGILVGCFAVELAVLLEVRVRSPSVFLRELKEIEVVEFLCHQPKNAFGVVVGAVWE